MANSGDDNIDRILVERFLDGRGEDTFRCLYGRHAPRLNTLLTRLVGACNGDAQDLVQATWIRAIQNLQRFRWESSLRTWLTGIALNCFREYIRKRKRTSGEDWFDRVDLTQPSKPHRAINLLDLERAVMALPDGYRAVLILHDIEGYTHEEIGRFLGVESGTSKSQLSRARRAVRVRLAESNGKRHENR
ncbi:RNA polymerase sigma factor [bacterium]|nr:RNA polymerase sigma factor [candidate division CSSED10-310 bacterium]